MVAFLFLTRTVARQMDTIMTAIKIIRNAARRPITSPRGVSVPTEIGMKQLIDVTMHIETSIPKLSVARPFSVARFFSVVILISVEGFVYEILIMRYIIFLNRSFTFNLNPRINAARGKAL